MTVVSPGRDAPEANQLAEPQVGAVIGPNGADAKAVDERDVEMNEDPKAATAAAAAAATAASESAASRSRRKYLWMALVAFLAIAIGLGVGLGVGLGLKGDDDDDDKPYSRIELNSKSGRTYFIAADKIAWNYAPSGKNLCYNKDIADRMMPPNTTRVGGTFTKAQYREYTDSSFKELKTRPAEWEHLGNLGPVLYSAVNDVIRIVFRNNLPFEVNIQPIGGVIAWDGDGKRSARGVPVAPGDTVTYFWAVPKEAGPVPGSTVSSRLWLYGSSIDPQAHDNAGLVGPIIVTSEGVAGPDGRPNDVDREFVTVFQVVKERISAMLAVTSDLSGANGVSYTKYAINGYAWCNMPASAIKMRTGERVRWHLASVGDWESLHNYHWHGHGVELNGHHVDQFTAIPSTTYSVNMAPDEPGVWMFHCHVNSHMDGGMVDLYTVEGDPIPFVGGGRQWVHYVAAEEVEWSYTGPNNTEMCHSEPEHFSAVLTDDSIQGNQFVNGPSTNPVRLGYKYTKTLFREYTDDTFTTLKLRAPEDEYLGLLGPVFRASVGDTIKMVLLNKATKNVSAHPHGVRYGKASEGTLYEDGTTGEDKLDDNVQPGQQYTYEWQVSERSGPGPKDPSSMLWMYHGHLDETSETYAGLAGAIIVTAKDKVISAQDPRPNDVDREVIIFFTVVDEIKSANFMDNLRTRLGDGGALADELETDKGAFNALVTDPDFMEHMLKHGINGYMYCHMPKLTFMQGDKVRLHVMVLGTLEDMHTPNMGGPRFDYNSKHTDSIQISPGGMVSADVVMTTPGEYELQCRVADHVMSGMRAKYEVLPDPEAPATTPSGVTRTYYIQAEPVAWDYAPSGYIRCTHSDNSWESNKYVKNSWYTVGSQYRKAVYREYTDETFTKLKAAPAYYGTMGPTITVEAGDELIVHLRNNLTDLEDFPINIALGGGLVALGSEGDSCAEVAAGETCVYRWIVPDSAGPASGDFNAAVYGYTSTVDVVAAPAAGLAGALMVAARGQLKPGSDLPKGVDLVIPLYWQVVNEELSPYYDRNVKDARLNETAIDESLTAVDFHQGNKKYSINGFVYCNMPNISVKSGTVVRWVFVAYGTEGDFHTPHFEGQSVMADLSGYSTMATLMPSIARVADMLAGDKGLWLLSCTVHDHYVNGQVAQFIVN